MDSCQFITLMCFLWKAKAEFFCHPCWLVQRKTWPARNLQFPPPFSPSRNRPDQGQFYSQAPKHPHVGIKENWILQMSFWLAVFWNASPARRDHSNLLVWRKTCGAVPDWNQPTLWLSALWELEDGGCSHVWDVTGRPYTFFAPT